MISTIEIIPGKEISQQVIVLPYRDLKKLRYLGIIGCLFTSIPILFGVTFAWGPLQMAMKNANPNPGLPLLFTLPFVAAGIWICWKGVRIGLGTLGILTNRTRTQISINSRQIECHEYFGLVSLRRKITLSPDYGLVAEKTFKTGSYPKLENFLGKLFAEIIDEWYSLKISSGGADRQAEYLAVGYSESTMIELKSAIRSFVPSTFDFKSQPGQSAFEENRIDQIENLTSSPYSTSSTAPIAYQRPAKTKVQLDRRDSGITFFVPPQGLIKGSHGLFLFGVIWLLFTMIFVVVELGLIPVKGNNPGKLPTILFLVPFNLVGVAIIVAAAYLAKRSTTVASSDGMLMVSEQTIFGKRLKQWDEGSIRKIEVGPSTFSVNGKPVPEIHIYDNSGDKFNCLGMVRDEELNWIAWELSNSLQLYQQTPPTDVHANRILPPDDQ